MKAFKYKEIMPKVAIEKLKLIEPDELIELIGKDIESILCFLAASPYSGEIMKIPVDKRDDPIFIEAALNENYAKTFNKLIKFSQSEIKQFLLAFSKKFEAANIKTILRAIVGKMNFEEAVMHIIPIGTLDRNKCRVLLTKAKTIEDAINLLAELGYASIFKETFGKYVYSSSLLPLELALDKVVYEGILEAVENLKGLDRDIARSILEIEIDSINIKVILRGKSMGFAQDRLRDFLIPSSPVTRDIIEEMINAPDLKSTIKCLSETIENAKNPFYKRVFNQFFESCFESPEDFEILLDRAPLKASLILLKKHLRYYNIGFILAFLNLKWSEIRNLRCLIIGSKRKIPSEQIKKFMIFPSEL